MIVETQTLAVLEIPTDWCNSPANIDEDLGTESIDNDNFNKLNGNQQKRRTRTAMLEDRRMKQRPHISYDIDGDGAVNAKDYMLAKHFDKDGDGRLNTAERKEAMKAIDEGFEGRFVWGIEKTDGGKDHIRIMQKRGKVLVGEDFTGLTDTYPVHPLTQ